MSKKALTLDDIKSADLSSAEIEEALRALQTKREQASKMEIIRECQTLLNSDSAMIEEKVKAIHAASERLSGAEANGKARGHRGRGTGSRGPQPFRPVKKAFEGNDGRSMTDAQLLNSTVIRKWMQNKDVDQGEMLRMLGELVDEGKLKRLGDRYSIA